MGYDLYPDYQKHGYMQEALAVILDFAKTEMHVRRMEVHIAEDNIKSHITAKGKDLLIPNKLITKYFEEKTFYITFMC
ncbi:hypothetical protein lbkm_1829 [Lachnospiraceae bacterium KM106-2]|nr:hypothetical protein lbkm_1829 [Lachnospiraceae bacterium KM106-2]